VGKHKHTFGGKWTILKLDLVRKYLQLYTKALKNQNFRLIYVDAFAGTGYLDSPDPAEQVLFDMPELQQSLRGSAQIALEVDPKFDQYVFVDKDRKHCSELDSMMHRHFPSLVDRTSIVCRDANDFLIEFCGGMGTYDRAVLFLDPYGLQVVWDTVRMIGTTQKVDMWYLFPLGVAVNRLLRTDARVQERERQRLDTLFGEKDSYRRFYRYVEQMNLFGDTEKTPEKLDTKAIAEYFHRRLKSAFAGVAGNYRFLYNSKNVLLFVLYFAVGNPRAQKLALHLAGYVLEG
jgi:three-Cys-motif partner protein